MGNKSNFRGRARKLANKVVQMTAAFLNCLYGSKAQNAVSGRYYNFLSCLRGRKLLAIQIILLVCFLSCLHGRKPLFVEIYFAKYFLSCLCGRKLQHKNALPQKYQGIIYKSSDLPLFCQGGKNYLKSIGYF